MKKNVILGIFIAVIVAAGFAFKAEAQTYAKGVFKVMQSDRSNEILHPGAMVKSKYYFASTTEAQVCTGKCAIFDIIQASGADGAYAIVYDSAPAAANTTTIFAKLEYDGTGVARGLPSNGLPFVTTHGLSVDLSSVSGGEQLLILYKDLD